LRVRMPLLRNRSLVPVFDAARDSILDIAREAYSRGRKNLLVLTSADFRHQASRRF